MQKPRIYLDYAATTPLDPQVFKAMQLYFSEKFGNAGSIHSYGQEAMTALDKSRETVAKAIGAKFNEIIFTSSATEANNLALRGIVGVWIDAHRNRNNLVAQDFPPARLPSQSPRGSSKHQIQTQPRMIVSAIEHESILETAKDLEMLGVEVIYLSVTKEGFVDLAKLKKSINENTILVSIMYANNEIGTIQPVQEIAKIIREYKDRNGRGPLLHTDAVQAFQYLNCNVDNLHVDTMTLSSHKIYGPKGAGALYVRNLKTQNTNNKQIRNSNDRNQKNWDLGFDAWDFSLVKPMVTGGGQEFGYRSSTENIPAIVGFAKAVEIADEHRAKEAKRVEEVRDYLWKGIKKIYAGSPGAQMNGSTKTRLPNNLNVYLPGISSEELIIKLDLAGIAISSGSACEARSLEPSYVIKALGFKESRAKESVRITLGRPVDRKTIDRVISIIKIIKNSQ